MSDTFPCLYYNFTVPDMKESVNGSMHYDKNLEIK